MTACTLCGLPTGSRPIRETDLEGEFCCRGCLEVHRTVEGISDADDTETLESITPAELADEIDATASTSGTALEEAPPKSDQKTLESGQGTLEPDQEPPDDEFETAFLSLEGMHCTTCERFLEAVAAGTDGISSARASYATEMIRLRYDPDVIEHDELSAAVSGFGYRAVEPDGEHDDGFDLGKYRTIFAVLLAMPVMAPYLLFIYPTYLGIYPESFLYGSTVRLMVFVPLALWSTLIILVLGYPIFRSASVSLAVRGPTVDVLISIAVLAAYAYSFVALALGSRHVYFDVAVMVLVVVTVGNRVETTVKRRAIGTHAALAETRETTVQLLADDGSTSEVDRDACAPGERIIVTAGDRIPFDGTVLEGTGTVDEAFMTGEPVPLSASTGDTVIGGSILTDGSLVVEIDDTTSTLDRLVELLWNVQSTEGGVQRLVNTFAVVFVPLVVVIAGAATALWLAVGQPPNEAVRIGLSVLVVSCPCSLGIATPLALAAGSARAAENNTAVLSTNVLERITNSEIIVFDKTGTLTTGDMTVETVVADDPDTVLERAAAVESRSNHPIAAAIVDVAPTVDPTVAAFDRGPRSVSAAVDGKRVTVGHPETFRTRSDRRSGSKTWEFPDRLTEAVTSTREDGFQPTVVGWDGVVRGVVAIRDQPRDNWKDVVATLSSDDRRIVVLTGDDERATQWLRSHPDVDDVFAGVRPESKEAILRRLREEGTTTMIGDGTNDAPALARADVGIALEEGTDIAVDAADVVVRDTDLEAIPAFFTISRSTRRRIRQNLGWAVCYNVVAIPLAVAGLINPLIAAVMMGVSSLIVVVNSGRGSLRRHSTKVADESER